MKELPKYPENRMDIRVDAKGNVSYEQNAEFVKYYAPTREEIEEELEELKNRLELLEIDEPADFYSDEHDDWENDKQALEDEIEELEDEIDSLK